MRIKTACDVCETNPNKGGQNITVGSVNDIITHEQSNSEYSRMLVYTAWCNPHTHIKVRLRFGEDTAKKTEIFFKNDSMEEFLWNYNFKAVANSGDFKDIYIKTSNNEFWTGEINSLYYDVFSGSSSYINALKMVFPTTTPRVKESVWRC